MSDPRNPHGRAELLLTLREALEAAAHGRGRFLVLEGEGGIGKTTLVDALVAEAQALEMVVLRAESLEMQRHRPFGVLADALGADVPTGGPRARELASLLAAGGEDESEGWTATQFRVEEALLSLLEDHTHVTPLLLVVGDLHWADPASVALLHRLARAVEPLPLLVLATARPHPHSHELGLLLESPDVRRIDVGALADDVVAGLAAELLGAVPGPRLTSRLSAAGGNPLYLREMLAGARREGVLRYDDGHVELDRRHPLPSFNLSLIGRLNVLSRDTLQVLRVASVLGSQFSVSVLAPVSGLPAAALWPVLDEAIRARILHERETTFAFRHELIREACYHDLPLAVRQAMHGEVAEVLERVGAGAAVVADHVLRSARPTGPEASERLRRAGAAAARGGAPGVAVDLLRAALDALPDNDPVRMEVAADLGLALLAMGRPGEGDEVLRSVLSKPLDPALEAKVRLALQQALAVQGRLVEALAEARAGAAEVSLPAGARARFEARASMGQLFLGDVDGALETALRAEAAAVAADDTVARVRAILTRAHVAGLRGHLLTAVELAAEAVALAVTRPTVESFSSMPHHVHSLSLLAADDIDGAHRAAEAAQQVSQRYGVADGQVIALLAETQALFFGGRCDDALAAAEVTLTLAEETGTAWQVEVLCMAALAQCRLGRRAEARALLGRAEAKVRAGQPAYRLGWIPWVHAVLAEMDGRPQDSFDALLPVWTRCRAIGVRSEEVRLGPVLARAALAIGRDDVAQEVASALEELAELNPDLSGPRATATRVCGLANGDPDALVEAARLHDGVPQPYERACCWEEAALALLGAGRRDEARDAAERAVAGYADLRADGDLARCRSALRSAGLRLGVRGVRRRPLTGWEALTATETEVARLVASRLSNPQVAEQMFLSRRTVAHHVSRVLAKLGLTTRNELVAAAESGRLEDL